MTVILASQSPQRRRILQDLGLTFDVRPSDVPELSEGEPNAVAVANAVAKTSAITADSGDIVIGCDTVADVEGELLGKPRDRDDAARMLKLLSGRTHSVWSGLCVVDSQTQSLWMDVAESQLTMTPLTTVQLDQYLDSQAWAGKSGAFGYQDGHPWLRIISGTAENVVGLPLDVLQKTLLKALHQ